MLTLIYPTQESIAALPGSAVGQTLPRKPSLLFSVQRRQPGLGAKAANGNEQGSRWHARRRPPRSGAGRARTVALSSGFTLCWARLALIANLISGVLI